MHGLSRAVKKAMRKIMMEINSKKKDQELLQQQPGHIQPTLGKQGLILRLPKNSQLGVLLKKFSSQK